LRLLGQELAVPPLLLLLLSVAAALQLEQHQAPLLLARPAQRPLHCCSFVTLPAEISQQMQLEVLAQGAWQAIIVLSYQLAAVHPQLSLAAAGEGYCQWWLGSAS
jgi:hypothetical protein